MSIKGRKKTTLGPDHSGAPKRGFYAGPTDVGLAPHHGPGFGTNAKRPKTGNVARDGAAKRHESVPVHSGFVPQPAGGRGHAQGAAVDSGGVPVAGDVHPFAKAPSPQLAHGKAAPVKDGMRNRTNDHAAGGASADSDCSTGDAARELSFADPNHPDFRGKTFDCGD